MTDEEKQEESYNNGYRAAWLNIGKQAKSELGASEVDFSIERAQVIEFLRSVCLEFGDMEWDENLHIVDILNKHLFNHVLER